MMISLNPAKLNRCDWFIIVWVLYYLQGVLYSSGGAISTGLLGINLLVSIYCAIKIWQMPNNPPYIKGLNLLVVMFSIYGFAHIINNPSVVHYAMSGASFASYNYIKSIYLSILPIYAFYYFSLMVFVAKRNSGKFTVSVLTRTWRQGILTVLTQTTQFRGETFSVPKRINIRKELFS